MAATSRRTAANCGETPRPCFALLWAGRYCGAVSRPSHHPGRGSQDGITTTERYSGYDFIASEPWYTPDSLAGIPIGFLDSWEDSD